VKLGNLFLHGSQNVRQGFDGHIDAGDPERTDRLRDDAFLERAGDRLAFSRETAARLAQDAAKRVEDRFRRGRPVRRVRA